MHNLKLTLHRYRSAINWQLAKSLRVVLHKSPSLNAIFPLGSFDTLFNGALYGVIVLNRYPPTGSDGNKYDTWIKDNVEVCCIFFISCNDP